MALVISLPLAVIDGFAYPVIGFRGTPVDQAEAIEFGDLPAYGRVIPAN
jgi:hypothetical protein